MVMVLYKPFALFVPASGGAQKQTTDTYLVPYM